MSLNALIYSQQQNRLITSDQRDTYGISSTDITYDELLSNTTIKKACCVYNGKTGTTDTTFNVNVKIPIPSDKPITDNMDFATVQRKFNFFNAQVKVPSSMCPVNYNWVKSGNVDIPTDQCKNFMKLYCSNVKDTYKKAIKAISNQNVDSVDNLEFSRYSTECACYGDPTEYVGPQSPPSCYVQNCLNSPAAFVFDTTTCNATNCISVNNFNNINAGGGTNLNTNTTQNCGPGQTTRPPRTTPPPEDTTTTPPSGTTTTPPSGTTTTPPSGTTTKPPSGTGITTAPPSAFYENTQYQIGGGSLCICCICCCILICVVIRLKSKK